MIFYNSLFHLQNALASVKTGVISSYQAGEGESDV